MSGNFGYWGSGVLPVSGTALAVYYALYLIPVMLLTGMWLYNLSERIRGQLGIVRLLDNGEEYSSDVAPENVRVIVADRGNIPVIRAGMSLLCAQRYIVVSQVVVESLSRRELESVIAHEVYHIRNRDWLANLAATLLSGLVGGRNSILVFYDYPKVERAADDYAAEIVGEKYLISALDELELLRLKAAGGRVFWNEMSMREEGNSEDAGMRSYLFKFYDLLFGSLLIDVSHLSLEERTKRLED
ncbi:M48 family metalloprotease [Halobacterium sp. NMX12-1]|uniref:M48 family metalloprotease n=1 Tax=Halobacterium sp. NMX12-1 TaxID=3166650 RepID=A0AAU8CEE8_9EURY